MESIWQIYNENFYNFIASRNTSALYSWEPGSSHDKYMKYRIRKLAVKYPEVAFGMMDVGQGVNKSLASILNIRQVPMIHFFVRRVRKLTIPHQLSLYQFNEVIKIHLDEVRRIEELYRKNKTRRERNAYI